MLADLRIRNLAVIEDLEIAFESGFNVITGETGAGKTMLMRAIGLLLGDRAATDLVRAGAAQAEVEALFTGPAVARALAPGADAEDPGDEAAGAGAGEPDLPTEALSTAGAGDDEASVRRVIAATGRQRALLNDRLVTAARLAGVGEHLVHIYGQHEHHTLLRAEAQRAIVDAAGNLGAHQLEVARRFRALRDLAARLDAVRAGAGELAARRELLAFQVRELDGVGLQPGEPDELAREREVLRHAERLHAAALAAEQELYAGEGAVVGTVARLAARLGALAEIDAELGAVGRALDDARPALEDAALRAGARGRAITADPERLEHVEERLALLQRLARKHGCTADELVERRARAEAELGALEGDGADPAALERALADAAHAAWEAADELSVARASAAKKLGARVTAGMRELALGDARLTVALEPITPGAATPPWRVRAGRALSAHGAERVQFLFVGGRGEGPRPLARVASGGELSRVMLALKAATATGSGGEVPTLLFDEVDAGIGGAVAEAVGRKLAALARERQVICITHLPQIAACADHHFVVRTRTRAGRRGAAAERLADDERIEELARMLAGATITTEARRHAAELRRLGRARR